MYNLIDMDSQHIEGSDDDGIPEGNSLLGSKDLAPNRNAKSDRSRRIWSVREEDILMATLKELAANGWKSDNGFRNDWKDVFGNDRADGEKRIDIGAAAGTIYGNKDEAPAADETSTHMSLQDLFPDMIFPEGVLPEMIDESQSATEGGGPGSAVDVGVGAGGEAVGGTGTTIGAASGSGSMGGKKVSKKVLKKQWFDLSNKRSEVFDQLKGIPRLSLKLQFYISKKLVKEPELFDLFRGLPETARAAFVFDLLEADEKSLVAVLWLIKSYQIHSNEYGRKVLYRPYQIETPHLLFRVLSLMANNGAMEYLRLPSFMKKFSEATSLNELRIPPEFVALHGANLPFDCRLITLLGRRSFPVRMLNIASGCHFHAGCAITQELDALLSVIYKVRYRNATGYGDSDHSDAPDVDTSDDYVPMQSEGSFSSDGDDYASDAGVLDDDVCPTFTVNLDASNINCTLEIPMVFWHRHIRMISLQDPIYFNVNGDSWYIILDHNETKIWVKRGWRRFKERNNLVVGVRCHFKLIDQNDVQFYVWFDWP
ncbi:hypothetical protein SASPL_147177 [Salvia splendens]|uniref:TF-B3 domain-containing protein n=1 Tax=Salvia splendens TaxID=180675 RepID=A0A8X8WDJ9_SALSN|nr:hypothetical protein SASPL_147177 [Salvia splendens]